MSKKWTEEQRLAYNKANSERQKEIRRKAKELSKPIQITITNASPELIALVVAAMEGK